MNSWGIFGRTREFCEICMMMSGWELESDGEDMELELLVFELEIILFLVFGIGEGPLCALLRGLLR